MITLGIDSSSTACSVALIDARSVRWSRSEPMARGQSERLVPMIEEALEQAALVPSDLQLIAVTRGPGAFTGLRIGLAAARGLALALHIPCLGISAFAAIHAALSQAGERVSPGLCILDSGRDRRYAQAFDATGHETGDPMLVSPEEIPHLAGDRPVFGTGLDHPVLRRLANRVEVDGRIDPVILARLAQRAVQAGTAPPPRPLYLREADATRLTDLQASR